MPTETATETAIETAMPAPALSGSDLPRPALSEPVPSAPALPVPTTDAELLMQFVEHRDHAAFRRLAERHAGLVASVCRRVLWNEQDVEDACQATLMVLARRAGAIRWRVSIAGWLFRVAHRTAVRAARLRRHSAERPLEAEPTIATDTLERLQSREVCEILASELERLPEHYRVPLILLYIEGKSIGDAAEELDCTDAALKGRVARARRLLRERLLRRGVALSVALGVWLRGTDAAAATLLTDQSIQTAIHYGATGHIGPGCPPNPAILAKGTLTMPTVTATKSTLAVGITLLLGLAALTAADLGRKSAAATDAAGSEPAIQSAADPADVPAEPVVTVALAQADAAVAATKAAADPNTAAARPRGPVTLDLKARSPAEDKIEAALEATLSSDLEFTDNTLTEVLDFIADAHEIKMLPDTKSLADVGVNLDEQRVTLVLSNVRLDSALKIILEQFDLAYVIEDEVLKILPKDAAASRTEMRVYVVTHLEEAGFDPEQIKLAIEKLDPEAVVQVMNGHLAVMQSQAGHRKTKDLLEQFSRAASVKP